MGLTSQERERRADEHGEKAIALRMAGRADEAILIDVVEVANHAADQFLHLVMEGRNYHGDLVEALHVLSVALGDRGDPGWDQPLVLA
jgi:hypothetical protein